MNGIELESLSSARQYLSLSELSLAILVTATFGYAGLDLAS